LQTFKQNATPNVGNDKSKQAPNGLKKEQFVKGLLNLYLGTPYEYRQLVFDL
jgi:hypothetical protein